MKFRTKNPHKQIIVLFFIFKMKRHTTKSIHKFLRNPFQSGKQLLTQFQRAVPLTVKTGQDSNCSWKRSFYATSLAYLCVLIEHVKINILSFGSFQSDVKEIARFPSLMILNFTITPTFLL